jgi:hypothetical protein
MAKAKTINFKFMNQNELLELGFIDTSYTEDGIDFTEFTLTKEKFIIEVSGIDNVEIKLSCGFWNDVPNCKTIEDLKQLIKLFK